MPTTRPAPLTLATLPDHMVWVEGGVFEMGSDKARDEHPIHPVQLESFFLCRYPVTQALWEEVMGNNPSEFPHPQRPVERVSWYDCIEFCNALSELQGYQPVYHINREREDPNDTNKYNEVKWPVTILTGTDGYRLPTNAELEYASCGGRYAQKFEYTGSPNLNETAWSGLNSQNISQPIGLKGPNSLGLFDMIGNVSEWYWDREDISRYQITWGASYPKKYLEEDENVVSRVGRILVPFIDDLMNNIPELPLARLFPLNNETSFRVSRYPARQGLTL